MISLDFLYGIVLLSIIPVRTSPSEQSEMVTQLMFGDTFSILGSEGDWIKIRNDFDEYEGWLSKNMIYQLSDKSYKEILNCDKSIVHSLTAIVKEDNQQSINILIGSTLPDFDDKTKTFKIDDKIFHFEGSVIKLEDCNRENIVNAAKLFLNSPYLWGGKSPYGIDCSGLVQQVFKLYGIKLPRDAYQQVSVGTDVSFLENANKGDLAFFDNKEGKIVHVGILIGRNRIIHASGKVRIDSIDQQGIYNTEISVYTHKLRTIRNVLN